MHTLSRCVNITPSQNRARGSHYYGVIQQTRLTYFFFPAKTTAPRAGQRRSLRMRDCNSHVILGLRKKSMHRIFTLRKARVLGKFRKLGPVAQSIVNANHC